MKITNKIPILLVCALSVGGCNYLDKYPDTERSLQSVFGARNTVEDWLAGVYSAIPCPMWDYAKEWGTELYADDLYFSPGWYPWWSNQYDMIYGNWTTTLGNQMSNQWWIMPQNIRRAMIFIREAHALEDLPASEIELMKAECRFLAAYYYWILLENWGSIPFRPGWIAPTDASLAELHGGQVPFDDVVAWLDGELLAVSKLLPAKYAESKYGRATSIMCLTVRSKMLLFAASPLVNGTDYLGHVNFEGKKIFNPTYDATKWTKARVATKELIDEAERAGHKLYVELNDDGSIDPFMSLSELWFTKDTKGNTKVETLFPWTKLDDGKVYTEYFRHCTTHAKDMDECPGGLGLYQGMVDAFFMRNGLPIDHPDSEYVEQGFTSGVDHRNTKWVGGGPNAGDVTLDHTWNMYANREPRFYLSVGFNGSWLAAVGRRLNFLLVKEGEVRHNVDNNGTRDAPNNGYLMRKKCDPSDNPNRGAYRGTNGGFNCALYRLAATYLDYAEVLNEDEDTAVARAEALEYVNRIRQRAGVRGYTLGGTSDETSIAIENNRETVRVAIRAERRVELISEGVRRSDIRRWKIAHKNPEVTGYPEGMNFTAYEESDFYRRVPVSKSRVWKDQYYWQPIHINDIERNPNLVQNPGW